VSGKVAAEAGKAAAETRKVAALSFYHNWMIRAGVCKWKGEEMGA